MTRQDVTIRPTAPYSIQFSTTADRANPTDLDGASVAGAIYVFVSPATGVDSVTFYENPDDGPHRTDAAAPFDLEGATGASANPLDVNVTFGVGDQTVYAVLALTNGNCITLHATFTVQGGAVDADLPPDRITLPVAIATPTIAVTGNQTIASPAISRTVSILAPSISTSSSSLAFGDTNAFVERRLLTDPNVKFIWNMNNPAGALATIGGAKADSSNFSGSLATIRFFESAPARIGSVDIGNCERLRFPVPGEGGSTSTSTLTYGEFSRRWFSDWGMGTFRDLYFRYYVYIPSTFECAAGGKLPSLASVPTNQNIGSYMSAASTYNPDSWWAGIMWAGPASPDTNPDHNRIECYIYAAEVRNQAGSLLRTGAQSASQHSGYNLKARAGLNQDETVANAGGAAATGTGAYLYFNRGAWNLVEQHVTLNTAGSANGKYRLWLNGVLALNIQYIKWADDAYNATADINVLMNDTFFGGPSGAASTQTLYKAEYAMSAAYIGARTAA